MDPYRYGFKITTVGTTGGFRGLHNPNSGDVTASVFPINGVGETYNVRIKSGETIPVVGFRVIPSLEITGLK